MSEMQIEEIGREIELTPYFKSKSGLLYNADSLLALKKFPDECIDCIITSPPYYKKRDYQCDGQIGLEDNFNEYIDKLYEIFMECFRILKMDGTCWIAIDDSYGCSGRGGENKNDYFMNEKYKNNIEFKKIDSKNKKSLLKIPDRLLIKLIDSGWKLRNEIIWYKQSAMPESVKDRFTKDFEKIFFLTKSSNYNFNQQFEEFKSNESDINKKRNKGKENYGKNAHLGVGSQAIG